AVSNATADAANPAVPDATADAANPAVSNATADAANPAVPDATADAANPAVPDATKEKNKKYACEECQDFGMVLPDLEPGHRLAGKTFPCPNPHCQAGQAVRRKTYERQFKQSGVPSAYHNLSLETFEALGVSLQGKELAIAACKLFSQQYKQEFSVEEIRRLAGFGSSVLDHNHSSNSLVFTGEPGVGKTGLAISIAHMLMQNSVAVLYIRVQDLIGNIQETYGRDNGPKASDLKYSVITAPVVIFDEFNLQRYSSDRIEIMESIIRGRYNRNLPFIATTNLDKNTFMSTWKPQVGDVVATAHWIKVGGVKLRGSNSMGEIS
ncbi:MAG: ATP-binding protein, partial [Anaerolineales bacterium]